MDPEQLLRRMSEGQFENVAFADARRLVEALGFAFRKEHRGSHLVYRHPSVPTLVNLQAQRGQAKSYQLRQLLRVIQRYDLRLEERRD